MNWSRCCARGQVSHQSDRRSSSSLASPWTCKQAEMLHLSSDHQYAFVDCLVARELRIDAQAGGGPPRRQLLVSSDLIKF